MATDSSIQWAILWSEGDWRSEYRRSAQGLAWLELYQGTEIVITRPLQPSDEPLALAETWRLAVTHQGDGELLLTEPSRRIITDRRGTIRGGRRCSDSGR